MIIASCISKYNKYREHFSAIARKSGVEKKSRQTQGVHLGAAYQPNEGLVLPQLAVAQKGNEITIAPKVLEQIELRGRVVVGDAMFAQKSLSVQIVGKPFKNGGQYLGQTINLA